MNAREKFLATMAFDRSASCPKWEYGYWASTVLRWYKEELAWEKGIPNPIGAGDENRAEIMGEKKDGISDIDIHNILGFDQSMRRIP